MLQKIDFIFRLLGTGLSFCVFGTGGFFLGAVIFPLVSLFSSTTELKHRRTKWIISKTFLLFMNFMSWVGVLKYELIGREKIEEDAGCIILANHPTLIDVVALISLYPRANCFVKDGVFKNPLLGSVVSGAGYINGSLGDVTLEQADRALNLGDSLMIFPEGTRTVPNQSLELKRGAAQVALRLGRPIRLVHITMNPPTLSKSERWYNIPPRKAHMMLTVGEKILPSGFPAEGSPIPMRARHLTHFVKEKLESALLVR